LSKGYFGQGGVGNMDYSNFYINRRQTQQLAFAIIADIEAYVAEHCAEYEAFLKAEEQKERGEDDVVD